MAYCCGHKPWFAQHASSGSVLETLYALVTSGLRKVLPRRKNSTENSLGYTGAIFCVKTTQNIIFLAADDRKSSPTIHQELCRHAVSELNACEHIYPQATEVKFQFSKSPTIILHYVGGENRLAHFVSML